MITTLKILLLARFFSGIAYISSILLFAVIFLHNPYEFSPVKIAFLIGIFALADRGTSILWAFFIPRLGYKKALLVGTFICFLSILGIVFIHHYLWCALMLLTLGLGLSLESLATRLWISNIVSEADRIVGFSWAHRIMNAGFIVGSSVAFVLPVYKQNTFTLTGIALVFLLSFSIILWFFPQDVRHIKTITNSFLFNFKQNLLTFKKQFAYIAACLIVFLIGTFAICQTHILPFFFERSGQIPSHLGWALALNPLLILCFQGHFTKLFISLNKKVPWLGICLGLVLLSLAFVPLAIFQESFSLWPFIIVLTTGEMLIIPHIDYLLTLRLPSLLRPIIFSLMSIAFGLGRALTESGGILGINVLYIKKLSLSYWWILQSSVLGVFAVISGIFVFKFVLNQGQKINLFFLKGGGEYVRGH